MKKRIHVNQHICKRNKKAGKALEPAFTIKTYKSNTRAYEVEILGESKLITSFNKPLSCGATAWIETSGPVGVLLETGEWSTL